MLIIFAKLSTNKIHPQFHWLHQVCSIYGKHRKIYSYKYSFDTAPKALFPDMATEFRLTVFKTQTWS